MRLEQSFVLAYKNGVHADSHLSVVIRSLRYSLHLIKWTYG